ncbi:MAG: Ldh family oxidoreductase, partial [Dehalococcoidia bacterium]
MLERFKVKEDEAIRVQAEPLRRTVTAIFEKMNVPSEDARLAADVLVASDLRGVDSHGVSNMLRSYINNYNSGLYNPRPNVRIVREAASAATVDSDGGLGIIVTPRAMEIAIRKAEQTGVGMVTVLNGRHLGMAAYHAMMALEHDMIGVCMTSTRPSVLPTFGREERLGTNPIAIAAPAKEEPPFVL